MINTLVLKFDLKVFGLNTVDEVKTLGLKIAYLDDEPAICQMFKDNFESDNISVWTYHDPNEFLEAVHKVAFDIVFLDYRLPLTTGDILAQQLDPQLPKVMMTGDLAVHLDSEFLEVFYKPFNFAKIEQFLADFQKGLLPPK